MSRSIYILFFLFLCQSGAFAQLNKDRTTTTKIADLLATQPAANQERLRDAMQQLEEFSATDISALLQQLASPGTASNPPIEYAVNSYAYHVLGSGKERQRQTFAAAAVSSLDKLQDPANKGFVIRLLGLTGDDACISGLTRYLQDRMLASDAANALAGIGTENAGQALLQALDDSQHDALSVHLVNALGKMNYQVAQQKIIVLAGHPDESLRKTVYASLAKMGGKESGPVLRQAAKAAGYRYDKTDAVSAYLNYGIVLTAKGDTKSARKIAQEVFKATKQDDQAVYRAAALSLLTHIDGLKMTKTLVKGAKVTHPMYRHVALDLLTPYLNEGITAGLAKDLSRQSESVQISLLDYLALHQQKASLGAVHQALEQGSDAVRVAAARALFRLQGDDTIEELLPKLSDPDPAMRQTVSNILLGSSHPELDKLLKKALKDQENPAARMALLQVLGQRQVRDAAPMVLELLKTTDGSGPLAASIYHQLPNLVGPADLDRLLDLLTDTGNEQAGAVQQALVKSVQLHADPDGQTERILGRIQQTGTPKNTRLYAVLAGIGNKKALETLWMEASRSDRTTQDAAIDALAAWRGPDAIPVLVQLSRNSKKTTPQTQAIVQGLIRQISSSGLPAEQQVLLLRDLFDQTATTEQKRAVLKALESTKTYNALIFAGKFLDNQELRSIAANTVMGIALDNKQYYGGHVKELLDKVKTILSGSESAYLREAINKHQESLPKDPGFVPLFNGMNLSGWKGLVANPIKRASMDAATLAKEQIKADEIMRGGWYAENGELHFNGKGDNIATIKQYGDFEMLVDWKLSKEGKEGDAGIYLRGTPQVQIWDTSRVNVGAQVGSGGLYNNQKHPSKPLLVADNQLGEWNTFRIIMTGDRVTVYLNGYLVTDSVILENYWDRKLPIFPVEQLELQAHGTHVSYRDIHIRELGSGETFSLTREEQEQGFEVLFDGSHLDHWTGNKADYIISKEKTLAIYPKEGSGGNLYTKDQYGDFIFRFSFRLTPGANNGVGIRTPMEGDAAYVGMEIQVLDDGADIYKNLEAYQYHGSVYGIIPAKRGHLKPVGEWNEEEIYIRGDHIRVTLNGTVIVDGNLAEATKNGTLDKHNHPGLKNKTGHIGFLGHGSEVHFKNIRIKRL